MSEKYVFTLNNVRFCQEIGAINRQTGRALKLLYFSKDPKRKLEFQQHMQDIESRIAIDGHTMINQKYGKVKEK